MVATIVVGSERRIGPWMDALRGAGYSVEHCEDVLAFQDRFAGDPVEVLVIDVANADHGEAMLMAQVRTVWPDCRVIALPRDESYRSSALYRMGLWLPDVQLMQPVDVAALLRAVAHLRIRAQVDRIVRERGERQPSARASKSSVVLQCGQAAPTRWELKTH